MSGRGLSPEENEAAKLVAAVLSGIVQPLDIEGAPDLTPDFEVRVGHRRVALEVTSTKDGAVLSMLSAAFGHEWPGDGLVNDWHVNLPQPVGGDAVHVRGIMKGVVPVLAVLESYGVAEVLQITPWPATALRRDAEPKVVEAAKNLARLGVLAVRAMGPARLGVNQARLYASVSGGFSPNIDQVNELVTAAAQSNLKKLATAQADERHIFVWIHASAAEAEFAVFQGPPPSSPPELPAGIDVVWIAIHGFVDIGKVGVTRLWRTISGADWEELDPASL